jgi:hypothetical protein
VGFIQRGKEKMTEERYFDGRDITQSELETMVRIIAEVNIEAIIENGDVILQAGGDDGTIHQLARWDLRRLAAYSADMIKQQEGESGVFALAGLFSKCAQIILNNTEPHYVQEEASEPLGGAVRLFAGDSKKNLPE